MGIIKICMVLFLACQVKAQIVVTHQNVTIDCGKTTEDQSILCADRTESCLNDTKVQASCPYICGFCDDNSSTPSPASTSTTSTTTTTTTASTTSSTTETSTSTTETPTTTTSTTVTPPIEDSTSSSTSTTTATPTTTSTTTTSTTSPTTTTTTTPTTTTTTPTTTVDPITYAVIIEHINNNIIRLTVYIAGLKNESLVNDVEGFVQESLTEFGVKIVQVISRTVSIGSSGGNSGLTVARLVWDLEVEGNGKEIVNDLNGGIGDFGKTIDNKLPEETGSLYSGNDFVRPNPPPATPGPQTDFKWTTEHTITVVCVAVAFAIIIAVVIITVVVHKRRTKKMKLDIEERRRNYNMQSLSSSGRSPNI